MSTLMHRVGRHVQVLAVCDWNVDMLPSFHGDPYHFLEQRMSRHEDERLRLSTFMNAHNMIFDWPTKSVGAPGGGFTEASQFAPLTRLPEREDE
eukprot:8391957-Karenia_brevis.AAC.1